MIKLKRVLFRLNHNTALFMFLQASLQNLLHLYWSWFANICSFCKRMQTKQLHTEARASKSQSWILQGSSKEHSNVLCAQSLKAGFQNKSATVHLGHATEDEKALWLSTFWNSCSVLFSKKCSNWDNFKEISFVFDERQPPSSVTNSSYLQH